MSSRRLLTSSLLASIPGAVLLAALALVASTRSVETHPRITTTLLWQKDIAPIFQRRCFTCHSPNNVAFSMTTYAEARPWAVAVREEVLARHMPPWGAVAGYGRFQNDPSLTQGEWDLLVAWVDGGAPSGVTLGEEQVPPFFVSTMPTWDAGLPDDVLTAGTPITVAAGAAPRIVDLEMTIPFKTRQRVHGLAFKPGDRRVVRWASVYEAETGRWLFTWTPWTTHMHLPEGVAYEMLPGAKLRVEVAYQGTDEDVEDLSELGFHFDPAASGGTATSQRLAAAPVALAPGAAPTRTRGELVLEESLAVHALWPDLGAETGSVELTAYLPDGGVRPMLWVQEYRADWRSSYIYTDPVPLPRGTRLVLTAYAGNPGTEPVTAQPVLHLVRVPASATSF